MQLDYIWLSSHEVGRVLESTSPQPVKFRFSECGFLQSDQCCRLADFGKRCVHWIEDRSQASRESDCVTEFRPASDLGSLTDKDLGNREKIALFMDWARILVRTWRGLNPTTMKAVTTSGRL
jgi:hypothetical protein